jgi:hypothetical protein
MNRRIPLLGLALCVPILVAASGAPDTVTRAPDRPKTVTVPATSSRDYDVTEIAIGDEAGGIVAFPRYAWSMPHKTPVAQQVDAKTKTVTPKIDLPIYSNMEARDGSALWLQVPTSPTEAELRRYDSRTGEQVASVATVQSGDLFVGFGSLWGAGDDGVVRRIDTKTNTVTKEYPTNADYVSVALTTTAVWMLSASQQLFRIDPKTGKQVDESKLLALVPDPDAVLGIGANGHRLLLSTQAEIHIVDPDHRRVTGIVQAPDDSLFAEYNMVASGPNRFWAQLVPKENGQFPSLPGGQPSPTVRVVSIDAARPAVLGFFSSPYAEDLSTVGNQLWVSALREPRVFHVEPLPSGS